MPQRNPEPSAGARPGSAVGPLGVGSEVGVAGEGSPAAGDGPAGAAPNDRTGSVADCSAATEAESPAVALRRAPRVAARLAVSWNGRGRPVASSAIASPSSTISRAGSARTAATTSGIRAVMSSRLRVNTAISSPERCTWIRMPSSLTSTTAGVPVAASAWSTEGALCASIGASGRPTRRVISPSAAAPPVSAAVGDRLQVAGQQQGPAYGGDRHLGGAGDGVGQQTGLRALAQLAAEEPDQHPLLVGGGGGEEPAEQLTAPGLRPRAGDGGDGVDGRVDVGHGQHRVFRRWWQVAQAGVADPGLPLAQLAGQVGGAGGDLVRGEAPERTGQQLDLGPPAGGRCHGGGGGRQVEEPHVPILAATPDIPRAKLRGDRLLDPHPPGPYLVGDPGKQSVERAEDAGELAELILQHCPRTKRRR